MGAAQTRQYVDRRYEDHDVGELPDAPVEALRGLGKRVVTEQEQRTVPVEREELRVQGEPIPAGEGDGDAEMSADERTIELRQEQPVVDKRVVPKERGRVGKEVVCDQEQISEPVRTEQVEVDQPDGER